MNIFLICGQLIAITFTVFVSASFLKSTIELFKRRKNDRSKNSSTQ